MSIQATPCAARYQRASAHLATDSDTERRSTRSPPRDCRMLVVRLIPLPPVLLTSVQSANWPSVGGCLLPPVLLSVPMRMLCRNSRSPIGL